MTRARKAVIELGSMSHCHNCVRAVRQGFLCGEDRYRGGNLDHRNQWIEDELLRVSEIFAIDLTAWGQESHRRYRSRTIHPLIDGFIYIHQTAD